MDQSKQRSSRPEALLWSGNSHTVVRQTHREDRRLGSGWALGVWKGCIFNDEAVPKRSGGECLGSERPIWTELRSPKMMSDSLHVSPGNQATVPVARPKLSPWNKHETSETPYSGWWGHLVEE